MTCRGGSVTLAGPISGTGNVVVEGGGTATFRAAGANTYTVRTTIHQGSTLQIGSGGSNSALTDSSDIIDNGSLVFYRSGVVSYSGTISGSGNVVIAGGGTVTLSGSNTLHRRRGYSPAASSRGWKPRPVFQRANQRRPQRHRGLDRTASPPSEDSQDSEDTGGGSGLAIRQTGAAATRRIPPWARPTELLYDLQATSVTDCDGNDINYDADDNYTDAYSISPDGKTVTVNSADAIPADGGDGQHEHLRGRFGRQRRPGGLGGDLQYQHLIPRPPTAARPGITTGQ